MKAIIIKNKNFRENIENFPTGIIGLYYFYVGDELIYIGRAQGVRERLCGHFSFRGRFSQRHIDYDKIDKILVIEGDYDDEEKEIQKYNPRWNLNHNNHQKEIKDFFCIHCLKRHESEDQQDCPVYLKRNGTLLERMKLMTKLKDGEERIAEMDNIIIAMKTWF